VYIVLYKYYIALYKYISYYSIFDLVTFCGMLFLFYFFSSLLSISVADVTFVHNLAVPIFPLYCIILVFSLVCDVCYRCIKWLPL